MMEPLCSRFDTDADAASASQPETETDAPRPCRYCDAELPSERTHNEHLVAMHSDELFHCDECDTYVDKKGLILHMSLHAVEYAAANKQTVDPRPDNAKRTVVEKPKPKTDTVRDIEAVSPTTELRRDTTATDNTTRARSDDDASAIGDVPTTGSVDNIPRENAFSDRSDAEDGFDPLPESIFEAIEDSQDGRSPTGESRARDSADDDPPPASERRKKRGKRKTRICPICSKAYAASSSYFYHMKHVHGESEEHECEVCGRRFATRARLAQHDNLHTRRLVFECDDCGKKFHSKVGLYIHVRTHSSVRRWTCDRCPSAFGWRQQLLRHLKRHAAERAHVCEQCGRGFNVRCDLARHVRTHTAESHRCPLCGTFFAQPRYLKVHMDKKHNNSAEGRDPSTEPDGRDAEPSR